MSGHNKWSQIKNKKGANDQKKARIFTKFLKAISVVARDDKDPNSNPRLRSAIEKARAFEVTNENIERAINKSSEGKVFDEVIYEAYGPEKVAIIIKTLTDNKNRTLADLKKVLQNNNAKIADQGSVLWAFKSENYEFIPLYPQKISDEGNKVLEKIVEELEDLDDISEVVTSRDKQ
ncbi:MAG: YebC/PmpR family DNA-binding transcriptional regulator [Candidatus Pacebacteria bacterium]|nr:YebC/PmpR family DNA-binding transcriptional regulator [Candidatus Paceibacterota bacterium]